MNCFETIVMPGNSAQSLKSVGKDIPLLSLATQNLQGKKIGPKYYHTASNELLLVEMGGAYILFFREVKHQQFFVLQYFLIKKSGFVACQQLQNYCFIDSILGSSESKIRSLKYTLGTSVVTPEAAKLNLATFSTTVLKEYSWPRSCLDDCV